MLNFEVRITAIGCSSRHMYPCVWIYIYIYVCVCVCVLVETYVHVNIQHFLYLHPLLQANLAYTLIPANMQDTSYKAQATINVTKKLEIFTGLNICSFSPMKFFATILSWRLGQQWLLFNYS